MIGSCSPVTYNETRVNKESHNEFEYVQKVYPLVVNEWWSKNIYILYDGGVSMLVY